MVGAPVSASVATGPDAVVPDSDVPAGGLDTRWVVWSSDLELASLSPETSVEAGENDGTPVWTAKFNLHIDCLRGRNTHHILEGTFKATARALREAVERDPRVKGVPSTKGVL